MDDGTNYFSTGGRTLAAEGALSALSCSLVERAQPSQERYHAHVFRMWRQAGSLLASGFKRKHPTLWVNRARPLNCLFRLTPVVPVMPAVVVVTIAVPAAAKAVHAIAQPVPVDVSVAIGILVAPTRTHPMLIAAVGILPLIALVVVAIALRPVVAPVVYAVSVSILITVLASF